MGALSVCSNPPFEARPEHRLGGGPVHIAEAWEAGLLSAEAGCAQELEGCGPRESRSGNRGLGRIPQPRCFVGAPPGTARVFYLEMG